MSYVNAAPVKDKASFKEELDNHINRTGGLVERAHEIADKLYGGEPKSLESAKPTLVSSNLEASINDLSRVLDSLENAVVRIESRI